MCVAFPPSLPPSLFLSLSHLRQGHEPHRVEFSIEDAKRAGLLGKSGPWQQYTARMLTLRARAFALRDKFADVLKGLSMAEEALDIPQSQPQTVSAEVQPASPPSLKDKLKARLEKPSDVIVENVPPSPAQALQDAAQELAGEPVEVTVEDTATPPFVWRMGKWKSAHIADIDTSYLEWFVENGKDGDHKEAARAELGRRQNQVSLMGSESEEVA